MSIGKIIKMCTLQEEDGPWLRLERETFMIDIFIISNADDVLQQLVCMVIGYIRKYDAVPLTGVELRPFFTKILAWTTFVHFSNPGAKNPCLDAILTVFPSGSSEIRMLLSNESLFVIRNENKPIL